jgi:hypothetical protein
MLDFNLAYSGRPLSRPMAPPTFTGHPRWSSSTKPDRLHRAQVRVRCLNRNPERVVRISTREQGVPVEDVQYLVVHSDPRTTRLYGRREQKLTKNLGGEDFD